MDKRTLDNSIHFFDDIVSDVKSKKELHALDEEFIARKLREFFDDIHNYQYKAKVLEKLSKSKDYSQFTKSKEHDFLIKNVRAELRKVYGAFILKEYERKEKILRKLKDQDDMDTHIELLKIHKSTNERLSHYEQLYAKIFSKLPDKVTVLDVACGLNPIANIFGRDRIRKYIASDISSQDCKFLSDYFSKIELEHEVMPLDLVESSSHKRISQIGCDVCFIFKTLDGLERVERGVSEKLLLSTKAPIIAVTFPTLSLSGIREIKEYRRVWLEKMLDKLGWKWEKTQIENELLYLIEK